MKTMKFLGILFCLVLGCGMTNAEKRDVSIRTNTPFKPWGLVVALQ